LATSAGGERVTCRGKYSRGYYLVGSSKHHVSLKSGRNSIQGEKRRLERKDREKPATGRIHRNPAARKKRGPSLG